MNTWPLNSRRDTTKIQVVNPKDQHKTNILLVAENKRLSYNWSTEIQKQWY